MLGYDTYETDDGTQSDACGLEVVRYQHGSDCILSYDCSGGNTEPTPSGIGEFRPTLREPDSSHTPESDSAAQDMLNKLDEICEWLKAGAPGAQREKIMQSLPADIASEMCHKLLEAANADDMDGCALCGS
jgi:hypothetical protein